MHTPDHDTSNGGAPASHFLVGLLCGAALGAAIGLLLAPKTGVEMRRTLRDQTDRIRRRAGETYASASDAVSHLVDKGRTVLKGGRETVEDAAAEARATVGDVSSRTNY
jgi:gas vesicle protein